MRILCVGIEGKQASAIAAALQAELTSCASHELGEVAASEPLCDAILLGGEAFAGASQLGALRAATVRSTWILLGDAAEEALYVGVDAVLDSDTDASEVADEVWRAVSSRRDMLRWPKGFIERRVAVATPATSKLHAVEAAGFQVTRAQGAGLLTALRRAHHHAAVVDARATQGSLSPLIEAIHAYDPTIGVAAVVQTNEGVAAAREAGAAAVRMGALGGEGIAVLAEQAWLAWCRAQPDGIEPLRVRVLGNVGGVAERVRELGHLERDHLEQDHLERGAGPEVLLVSSDHLHEVDGDTVAVLVRKRRRGAAPTGPFVAELSPDARGEQVAWALSVAERFARQHRSIGALALRLHEVDTRRVNLLEQLADAQLEVDNLATLDGLTETFNRRGLEDALLREIEIARRSGGTIAACLVEIDDERGVHDRYGFRHGDDILQIVAERLKRALRLTDSIGRVGEDSFLLLMPQTRSAEALLVVERARDAVTHEPFLVGDASIELAITAGVAVLPWETNGLDDALPLLRDAVQRRRAAMASDPARDTMVDELKISGTSASEAAALDELLTGILSGEALSAVAQPIVRVSDEVVVGYEMLTRGREGIYEAPQKLLHFARHRGMLAAVDLRCMETCLAEAANLAPHLLVSFNLFPTTLLDMPIHDVVKRFAELPDARLCLELSEEQFVGDPRELADRIAALRSAGVKLAIDDVGKGRGTLDSVMLLEPDIVKIDKELITGASRDTRKERLLRRLVALAVTLGCEVVGEGVEKPEDLGLLRELEVPYAQGYLWAEPAGLDSIPPEDTVSSHPPAGAS